MVRLAAYNQIQPFGSERENWHMAVLASMYAGAHTGKGKQRPKLQDFMYIDQESKRRKETQSFLSKLSAKAKKHGK